jgi:uncharacterized membrane protein YphA (DoxX/SURF4 family)
MLVGFVFIYASIEKIADPAYFAGTLQNYQIIPDPLINIVAITLPWLELVCGLLLLTGFWHRPSAFIIALLMIVFIIAIVSVILRGLDIECGCFGTGTSADWTRIIEDLFLFAFTLQILIFPKSVLAFENISNKK